MPLGGRSVVPVVDPLEGAESADCRARFQHPADQREPALHDTLPGHDCRVRAAIRSLDFNPDPASLSADPAAFAFVVRMYVGAFDGPGEESFDLTVCSPEWLARQSRNEGFIDGRHHVIINSEDFDQHRLQRWLEQRVSSVEGGSWREVGQRLARLGYWEFEDYRE
jgi:hypothetical protein